MTPADHKLATRIRAALQASTLRVSVSGLDGSGKSTLCAALAEALGLPVIKVPDPALVAMYRSRGHALGWAHALCASCQQLLAPRHVVLDRGALCVAAIHAELDVSALRRWAEDIDLTILLDLPLDLARARKPDPGAELRDREAEAARYRELAARWPQAVVIDASRPPGEVLSQALQAVARAIEVAP